MGLENGIVIIPKTEKGKDFLESFYSLSLIGKAKWKKNPWNKEWDFTYWQRCDNIRHKFLQEFSNKYDEDNQEIIFTFEDISKLLEVLDYFLDSRNWYADGDPLCKWHQCLPDIATTIHYFWVLIEKGICDERITEEDIEIFFYDRH